MDRLDLFRAHVEERFDDLKEDIKALHLRTENMENFKVSMIVTARTVSFIVSGVCGIITLLATVVLAWPKK